MKYAIGVTMFPIRSSKGRLISFAAMSPIQSFIYRESGEKTLQVPAAPRSSRDFDLGRSAFATRHPAQYRGGGAQ